MDTRELINLVLNFAVIIYCYIFADWILKDKHVVDKLGKFKSFVLRIPIFILGCVGFYSIFMYEGVTLTGLAMKAAFIAVLSVILYYHKKIVLPKLRLKHDSRQFQSPVISKYSQSKQ